MKTSQSFIALGVLFVVVGFVFLYAIDNALPATIMIVGGGAMIGQAWSNDRRGGRMRGE